MSASSSAAAACATCSSAGLISASVWPRCTLPRSCRPPLSGLNLRRRLRVPPPLPFPCSAPFSCVLALPRTLSPLPCYPALARANSAVIRSECCVIAVCALLAIAPSGQRHCSAPGVPSLLCCAARSAANAASFSAPGDLPAQSASSRLRRAASGPPRTSRSLYHSLVQVSNSRAPGP